MRPDDLLDAIGEVDDACIKQAKETKTPHVVLWRTVAQCII